MAPGTKAAPRDVTICGHIAEFTVSYLSAFDDRFGMYFLVTI